MKRSVLMVLCLSVLTVGNAYAQVPIWWSLLTGCGASVSDLQYVHLDNNSELDLLVSGKIEDGDFECAFERIAVNKSGDQTIALSGDCAGYNLVNRKTYPTAKSYGNRETVEYPAKTITADGVRYTLEFSVQKSQVSATVNPANTGASVDPVKPGFINEGDGEYSHIKSQFDY